MAKRIISSCLVCKSRVESSPSKIKKFCSKDCYYSAQRAGLVKVGHESKHIYKCDNCSKPTQRRPSNKRNGDLSDKVFCSRSCYDQQRSKAIELRAKPCPTCGKGFDSIIKKYCSEKCWLEAKKAKPKKCINCATLFTPVKQHPNGKMISSNNGKTCSHSCQLDWIRNNKERKRKLSEAFSGDKHPNWQGGSHNESYRGQGWRKLAEIARDRAGRQCERCGKSEIENGRKLDVNHIVPFHQHKNKESANRLSNLEALCRSCHTKTDWEWRKNNPVQLVITMA